MTDEEKIIELLKNSDMDVILKNYDTDKRLYYYNNEWMVSPLDTVEKLYSGKSLSDALAELIK